MRRFAIAPGDPAGIGYEITAQALFGLRAAWAGEISVIYGHRGLWSQAVERFAPGLAWRSIDRVEEADAPGGIYFVDVSGSSPEAGASWRAIRGRIEGWSAQCAHRALLRIVEDAQRGLVSGLCTGPIHKGAMRLGGVSDIGHTEILAHAFGVLHPLTLFMTRALKIFFYSRHLSLRDAILALNVEDLVSFGERAHGSLGQLGILHPRLALAALNPHASDGGQFGEEEGRILAPAVRILRARGIEIEGPIGADSVFSQAAHGRYDAVLSLYHDQGHIAAKTYDFDRTISLTLGLPILRTSVDHGTAMDIAWQGVAQSVSMVEALEALRLYG